MNIEVAEAGKILKSCIDVKAGNVNVVLFKKSLCQTWTANEAYIGFNPFFVLEAHEQRLDVLLYNLLSEEILFKVASLSEVVRHHR